MSASTILWGLGILATLASFGIMATSRPYRGGVITTGTVVQLDAERTAVAGGADRRMTTYAPVVQFTDQTGGTHEVTSPLSGGKAPEIGSTRQISYLPSDPTKARILATKQTIVPVVLFLVVGMGCLVAALTLS